jgi:hypothetical protein
LTYCSYFDNPKKDEIATKKQNKYYLITHTSMNHGFEISALVEWLQRADTCPICRNDIEFPIGGEIVHPIVYFVLRASAGLTGLQYST